MDVVSLARSALANTLRFLQITQDLPHPQNAVPVNSQPAFKRVYALCGKSQFMYRPYLPERVYTHIGLEKSATVTARKLRKLRPSGTGTDDGFPRPPVPRE